MLFEFEIRTEGRHATQKVSRIQSEQRLVRRESVHSRKKKKKKKSYTERGERGVLGFSLLI